MSVSAFQVRNGRRRAENVGAPDISGCYATEQTEAGELTYQLSRLFLRPLAARSTNHVLSGKLWL